MVLHGLDLSEEMYTRYALPLFEQELPELLPHIAVGLAGEGSDCFGFDDDVSQDHDWGPAFCLWLPEADCNAWRERIDAVLAKLPPTFMGMPHRMRPESRMGRVGLLSIEGFYARFIGMTEPPQTWRQWRAIPEHYLAVSTNGRVFADPAGTFTAFREALLAYYPEDVRLKKLAARCAGMAQDGQYNLPRALRRHETATAMLAAARFAEQAMSAIFLLNKRYMPFYKWAHRAVAGLPTLGALTQVRIRELATLDWREGPRLADRAAEVVEVVCAGLAEALRQNGLSEASEDWLMDHAASIQSRIQTPELRAMSVLLE